MANPFFGTLMRLNPMLTHYDSYPKSPTPAEQSQCRGFHPQHPPTNFFEKKLDQKTLNGSTVFYGVKRNNG